MVITRVFISWRWGGSPRRQWLNLVKINLVKEGSGVCTGWSIEEPANRLVKIYELQQQFKTIPQSDHDTVNPTCDMGGVQGGAVSSQGEDPA